MAEQALKVVYFTWKERGSGGGYDHLFSHDSPKAKRGRERGTSGTAAAIREKWTVGAAAVRPNVGQITFFLLLGRHKKREKLDAKRGRRKKWGGQLLAQKWFISLAAMGGRVVVE